MPHDLFISFAEEDWPVVQELAAGLRGAGLQTWTYKENSTAALSHLLQTDRAIRGARAFLLVISPASVRSAEVDSEVGCAHHWQRRLVPLLLDYEFSRLARRRPEWRRIIGTTVALSLDSGNVQTAIPQLIEALRKLRIRPRPARQVPARPGEGSAPGPLSSEATPELDPRSRLPPVAPETVPPAPENVPPAPGARPAPVVPARPAPPPAVEPPARARVAVAPAAGSDWIRIPGGQAWIGANEATIREIGEQFGQPLESLSQFQDPPARRVMVETFRIARVAVSNAEYREFLSATGWPPPPNWLKRQRQERMPVVEVTFLDAEAFCQWKGVRLPTDIEWERAARGPQGWVYPWGNVWGGSRPQLVCNTLERHRATEEELLPVDALPEGASPEGVLNLAGNVWEWVDGGREGRKHTRGGSWRYQGRTFSLNWFRLKTHPGIQDDDVGFRYAQDDPSVPRPRAELGAEELASTVVLPMRTCVMGFSSSQIQTLAQQFQLKEGDQQTLQRNPQRVVRLHSCRIRRYLVTNEEYYQFALQTGHPLPAHWTDQLLRWSDRPFLMKYRNHPVTNVSHADAVAFCRWLGGRLPTNDEWEYAARGEDGRTYPWGANWDPACCNVSESGWGRTTAVNDYPTGVSPLGCFDLAGNVREWVAPTNGQHYVRGGSYADRGDIHAISGLLLFADPATPDPEIGFRCAFD